MHETCDAYLLLPLPSVHLTLTSLHPKSPPRRKTIFPFKNRSHLSKPTTQTYFELSVSVSGSLKCTVSAKCKTGRKYALTQPKSVYFNISSKSRSIYQKAFFQQLCVRVLAILLHIRVSFFSPVPFDVLTRSMLLMYLRCMRNTRLYPLPKKQLHRTSSPFKDHIWLKQVSFIITYISVRITCVLCCVCQISLCCISSPNLQGLILPYKAKAHFCNGLEYPVQKVANPLLSQIFLIQTWLAKSPQQGLFFCTLEIILLSKKRSQGKAPSCLQKRAVSFHDIYHLKLVALIFDFYQPTTKENPFRKTQKFS